MADAAKFLAKRGQIPVFGAFVGKVTPGSPAQKAGLEPGDIIIELNLRQINNADDVEKAVSNLRPGAPPHIAFQRRDSTQRTQAIF